MQNKILALAFATAFVLTAARAQHAGAVISYHPGVGVGVAYTDPTAALGEPSRVTPGQFGGPVDPFNPAYLGSQLVGVGSGGSLTVRFDTAVHNDPANVFGLDFQIFSSSFFVVTNATDANFNYLGTPSTDGSVFGADGVATRVSVSQDGQTFFTLNPSLAPVVKNLFPTDGGGSFTLPVNPALKNLDFAGLTLDNLRTKYAGSGGGTGFDLAWAQDAQGQSVTLGDINFVRVDVLGGKIEIDGFSAVSPVPEPATWALFSLGLGTLALLRRRR